MSRRVAKRSRPEKLAASKYLEWKDYFMSFAVLAGRASKDPEAQEGACIVDYDKKVIISTGYKGMPWGVPDDLVESWSSEKKELYLCHATANAILNRNSNLSGLRIFVTDYPCNECAKLITQARISHVYYLYERHLHERQIDDQRIKDANVATRDIFRHAGIGCELFVPEKQQVTLQLGRKVPRNRRLLLSVSACSESSVTSSPATTPPESPDVVITATANFRPRRNRDQTN